MEYRRSRGNKWWPWQEKATTLASKGKGRCFLAFPGQKTKKHLLMLLLFLLPAMLPHVMGKVEKCCWCKLISSAQRSLRHNFFYLCFHLTICAFMSMLAINVNKLLFFFSWILTFPSPFSDATLQNVQITREMETQPTSWRTLAGLPCDWKPKWACSEPTTSVDTAQSC